MTMNCEDVEMLLADALGDELADADRAAFEAHLAECERCRREYETTRAAVQSMRALPGPQRVTVRREGDRSAKALRRAVAYGTVLASFNVEAFSLDRLRKIDNSDVEERLGLFRNMLSF